MMQFFLYSVNFQREAFSIPFINIQIYWYGILFAFGFYLTTVVCSKFLLDECNTGILNVKEKIDQIIQSLSLYLIIAIVLGARFIHVALYDGIDQLFDFYHLINLRDGGLASHGAVFFIIIAYVFWIKKYKRNIENLGLDGFKIFDCVTLSSLINAFFIRIGNFINQEIIGKPTDSFFGVIFKNPISDLSIVPRHPAQLYEAVFYAFLFLLLVLIKKKTRFFSVQGMLTSVFFILLFTGRFILEVFKENQSVYDHSNLFMGQILSLPLIIGGFCMAIYLKRDFLFKKLSKNF